MDDKDRSMWKSFYFSLGDVLLQPTQSLFRGFENIIVLAHSEAKVVLSDVGIGVRVELSRRNGSNANLVDEEPAKLEVARATSHMCWEWIIRWELH